MVCPRNREQGVVVGTQCEREQTEASQTDSIQKALVLVTIQCGLKSPFYFSVRLLRKILTEQSWAGVVTHSVRDPGSFY